MDLITDRTQEDVNNLTSKGVYSYTDLNRVETATKEIATLLTANGYHVNIEVKTDWTEGETLSHEQMKRYIDNVLKCESQFCSAGYELPNTMDGLNYIIANNIELTLQKLEQLVNYMLSVLSYSGMLYANDYGLRGCMT